MHFWMVFVVPHLKSPTVCEECVGAILRDSVLTSLKNRSSVGFLLGLPVDIDSILVNGTGFLLLFCFVYRRWSLMIALKYWTIKGADIPYMD